jgi:GGDEF domain-containing protein
MTGRDPHSPDERLTRATRAAHDLSDALWESLHDELAGARGERASELAQRLADVCAAIALLVSAPVTPAPVAAAPHAREEPHLEHLEPPEPSVDGSVDGGIEVHDARTHEPHPVHGDGLAGGAAHGEEGPSAWIGSISRRLERYAEDRLPFAVLLIEVLDIDRLVHAEAAQELTRLTTQVERAIGAALRPADLLTREALGRYWLVTPETDAVGARQLAERLAGTVRLAARHRGVPLELAIGVAICPEDGRDASTLAAHADVGVYAARASGRPIAPDNDPAA